MKGEKELYDKMKKGNFAEMAGGIHLSKKKKKRKILSQQKAERLRLTLLQLVSVKIKFDIVFTQNGMKWNGMRKKINKI